MPGGGVVHVPVSWLADHVELPVGLDPRELGEAFVRIGLEVESVDSGADGISGPVVLGRVLAFDAEEQKNGKTIRWCRVDVGPEHNDEDGGRGIVCGAANFAVGDLVIVSLPGAVLPGGFEIAKRNTYKHWSDGMICSSRELGIGDDHDGIMVLPPETGAPGDDALDSLGLREAVLTIAVTPDRGYCLSMRGLAREAAGALHVPFHDVADSVAIPAVNGGAHPVVLSDLAGCDKFSMRALTGLDPTAPSPSWMQERLRQAGMRAISLAVDVTNYVMLETGQPLHAYDHALVRGPIVVRRAEPGEKLTTLDGVERALHTADLLITDDSGPIGLAGVMGGASTEITDGTSAVLLEAAHFVPATIAGAVRRHRLPSEAAKRFERGVDPEIAAVALQRCVELLAEFGGATAEAGFTVEGPGPVPAHVTIDAGHAQRLVGMPISRETVVARLTEVGCSVSDGPGSDELTVVAPSWRPDLTIPADLVEEVARLEGYEQIPSTLPSPPAGRGLTEGQKLRRAMSRAVASFGATEVLTHPFLPVTVADRLGLSAEDERRRAVRVANPLSEAEPDLRTSLLPGLVSAALRNLSRGARNLALYELGIVFFDRPGAGPAPVAGVEHRPSEAEIAAMNAPVPHQPWHLGVLLVGDLEPAGWEGPGRAATWSDAIEFGRRALRETRVQVEVRAARRAPWHPGRCAEFVVDGQVVGYAGELHPRVVAELGLPERACAVEIDLDLLAPPGPAAAPALSGYPPVLFDVAVVVATDVQAETVAAALRSGGGELVESVRLFDVYSDAARLGDGVKSLAFALRLRATDRTLTTEEAAVARDAAIAEAAAVTGATLRS